MDGRFTPQSVEAMTLMTVNYRFVKIRSKLEFSRRMDPVLAVHTCLQKRSVLKFHKKIT